MGNGKSDAAARPAAVPQLQRSLSRKATAAERAAAKLTRVAICSLGRYAARSISGILGVLRLS